VVCIFVRRQLDVVEHDVVRRGYRYISTQERNSLECRGNPGFHWDFYHRSIVNKQCWKRGLAEQFGILDCFFNHISIITYRSGSNLDTVADSYQHQLHGHDGLERGAYFGNDFGSHGFGRAFQRNVHRRGQYSDGL
jgi:hypothetical protein